MEPIFLVLVFLTVVLAAEGLFNLVSSSRGSDQQSRARRRLKMLAGRLQAVEVAAQEGSILRGMDDARRTFGDFFLSLLPNRKSLELLLYRAGVPMTPGRFLSTSALLTVGGWLVLSALRNDPGVGLLGLSAGLVPWFVVRGMASKRMRQFEAQLPEGLELLTRALRAGHSLGTGFHLVGEEMADPLGVEFAQVAEEIKFGLDIRGALMNLAHRIDSPDVPYFVTAVLIQRETGGNLAELLDNLGNLVRERAKFHGKLRAITSQGRMTAAILAIWPAVTVALLVWTHPKYIQPLLETSTGHMALLIAAVLCVVGYLIARRLADVRV